MGDDWTEWTGGECPVDDNDWVDVRFADGSVTTREKAFWWDWDWKRPPEDQIVAYRVLSA